MKSHFKLLFQVLGTFFLGLLGLIIFIMWWNGPYEGYLLINDEKLGIEIANNGEDRIQGLSDKREIGSTGLLFIFPNTDKHGIWMQNMQFSIDILWLDSDFKVIHIEPNVSPTTFPKIFYPSQPAKYVFEADSGFAEKYKIELGQKLDFEIKN